MKNLKYKQLQFDTAIRNPERYKSILKILLDFENKKLNDKCILDIIYIMYINGIIEKNKQNENLSLSKEELINKIINKNKTRKADGGFPAGYQSRFWTYMRTLSEFSFVYSKYNDFLRISNMAKLLIENKVSEQEAFSSQAMIYNRKSPYKKVANDFNYFKFILEILLKLNEKNIKLKFSNFILSLYERNGDVDDFINTKINLEFSNDDELLEYIKLNYDDNNRRKTIINDYPDVVIRILRIMGFITIYSYDTMYISINKNNVDYIKDLLNLNISINENEKIDALKYYNRANCNIEKFIKIINFYRNYEIDIDVHKQKLNELISRFKIDEKNIKDLIKLLICYKKKCPIAEFDYIPEPLKLEFYISILLYLKFKDSMLIKPNYKIDDLGIPVSYAPGNIGDIEVFNNSIHWLIEVTLIRNRTQQYNNETTSVIRHLVDMNKDNKINSYLSFVAPIIHEDTEEYYKYSAVRIKMKLNKNNMYLKPYTINQFIDSIEKNIFKDMEEYTNLAILEIKNSL